MGTVLTNNSHNMGALTKPRFSNDYHRGTGIWVIQENSTKQLLIAECEIAGRNNL